MQQRATDYGPAVPAITAFGWAPVLQDINTILTTVSLLVGIGFVIWQWRRQARAAGKQGA